MNKKALQIMPLFQFGLIAMIIIIVIGIYGIIFYYIDQNLAIDVDVGQVNLNTSYQDTLGKFNQGFMASADTIGYFILFGMVMFMLVMAYFTRGKYPKLMLIIDIFLLVFAFVLTVYVSNAYETLITSTTYLEFYGNSMPKSSSFILNLPIYTTIIGVVIMIISYMSLPKEQNEVLINQYE